MGIEGRPERGSKTKALSKIHHTDDDVPDSDFSPVQRRTRKSSMKAASAYVDESGEENDDPDDIHNETPHDMNVAVYKATQSASRAVNAGTASRRRASRRISQEEDDDEDAEDPDVGLSSSENDNPEDKDFQDSQRPAIHLRLRVDPGERGSTITKSGRISKPPQASMSDLAPPTRRRSSADHDVGRPERYSLRHRSDRHRPSYDENESLAPSEDEEILDEQMQRRRISKKRKINQANLDSHDEEEKDDDRHYSHDIPHNGKTRTRGRLAKFEEIEDRKSRETRASRRSKSKTEPYPFHSPYATRRSMGKGAMKEDIPMSNGLPSSKDLDAEVEDLDQDVDVGSDGDRDFKAPSEEESEDPAETNDALEELTGDGQAEVDDEPEENPRRRSLRPRGRKQQPHRIIPPKRTRRRNAVAHDENSMAKRVRESYRPRNESIRQSDFYGDPEPTSDSSDSSGAPARQRRPTREAATRATDAIAVANDLSKVDFLQNPMALVDGAKAPRPKRRSTHRGRIRPPRLEPYVSDDDEHGPVGASPSIEPIQVDMSLSWEDIGGLEKHIASLKETVLFPLMYSDLFAKFAMEAPKGVLFYGPPGTGKTLCARALAASCGFHPEPEASNSPDKEKENASNAESGKVPPTNAAGGDVAAAMKPPIDSNANLTAEATNAVELLLRPISNSPDPKKPTDLDSGEGQRKPSDEADGSVPGAGKAASASEVPGAPKPSSEPANPKPSVKKKPRVAFFMRNGADCLSKWVGEAERQLRMTFEAAKRHQPSIIFFDEIDGLAPVRSSRQDQIHSSIVSTLLGLMDGLDSRGQIVVIGATNRVDAIDPALRRPGRFDREMIFTLPNAEARKKILQIHTKKWDPAPKEAVIAAVAKLTVGYCGADLKALCSEAAIRALRRRYPQIYNSNEKLLIDVDQVRVCAKDFVSAMCDVVPASHRSARTHARPIPARLTAVLDNSLKSCIVTLGRIFPQGLARDIGKAFPNTFNVGTTKPQAATDEVEISSDEDEDNLNIEAMQSKMSHAGKLRTNTTGPRTIHQALRPRLLVYGVPGLGQAQLGPAILHYCEGCPVHAIDFPSLHADGGARTAEEALISAFREAARSVPSILYLPHLQLWWESAPRSLRTTLIIALKDVPSDLPLLVLATAECSLGQLPSEVLQLFGEVHELSAPSEKERQGMFSPLVEAAQMRPAMSNKMAQRKRRQRAMEVLPKAPPPPPKPLSKEEERRKWLSETRYIRLLRMEMRAFVESLLRDRRYKAFWAPVDPTSAPDYYDIIKIPMDIQKIAANVDAGMYPTVVAMVNDFDILVRNAIQYNPPNTEVGAQILRRAHGLIDIVHAWVDNLNPALVETCNRVIVERIERSQAEENRKEKEASDKTGTQVGGATDGEGNVEKNENGCSSKMIDVDGAKEISNVANRETGNKSRGRLDLMDVDAIMNPPDNVEDGEKGAKDVEEECGVESEEEVLVEADAKDVEGLMKLLGDVSSGMTVDGLEGLYVQCEKVVTENRRNMDRREVVKALLRVVVMAREDPALVGDLVE